MPTTVWRNAIDTRTSSYAELNNRKVVAQGWPYLGDLSQLMHNSNWDIFCKSIDSQINKSGKSPKRNERDQIKRAFYALLFGLQPGDLVVGVEGTKPVGLCQITTSSRYLYDNRYDYAHGIGPVEWVNIKCLSELLKINVQELLGSYSRPPDPLVHDNSHLELVNSIWSKYLPIIKDRHMLEYLCALLQSHHQLVLTGPPGTGKTYLAKQLANSPKMTDYNKNGSETHPMRAAFVQFHPSYDYTDFVEGLRPEATLKNQISFRLHNGNFKEFCRKAGVVERILFERGSGISWNDVIALLEEFLPKDLNGKANPKLREFWEGWIKQQKGKAELEKLQALPPFVFIIDEINRAELSKVFGELMYSIEHDYRGPKGKIKTQYASQVNEYTWFVSKEDDWFFVPSNVYIIGTMNDIDRSVETFDFALRRRFAWHEISAEDAMEPVLKGILARKQQTDVFDNLISRARSLNRAIAGLPQLGPKFAIGPSYFAQTSFDGEDVFQDLWVHHLKPLLQEYLRGLPNQETILSDFKGAFDLKAEQNQPEQVPE